MSASTRSAYRSSAPRPPAPRAIEARSSPPAPSRDALSAAPLESGRVTDMLGTFRNSPAPSYDGADAGDRRQASRATLVREAETGGNDAFIRLAVVERLRGSPEVLVLNADVEVPRAVGRRPADRNRRYARDAQVAELVVHEVRAQGRAL